MRHACTLFVILLHALVSLHPTSPLLRDDSVREDVLLQIMAVFGTLIVTGEITRGHVPRFRSTIDYHFTALCLCAVCFVIISRLMCPAFGYCFFLHAMSSISLTVMFDQFCAPLTRVFSGFCIPVIAVMITMFPLRMDISSVAFFITHQSRAFPDTSFEIGHLWAIVSTSAVRVVLLVGYTVSGALHQY